MSSYILPSLIVFFIGYGYLKKVPIYDTFIEGAKEGFNISIKIIPYLVAIMVAVGMFRASGAIDLIAGIGKPFFDFIGMPADLIPLALTRSLSGSGARGIFTEIAQTYGGNAQITKTAAVMLGSSETTFYVLSVYFGSVGITKFRHAILAGIFADLMGIIVAILVSSLYF